MRGTPKPLHAMTAKSAIECKLATKPFAVVLKSKSETGTGGLGIRCQDFTAACIFANVVL